DRAEIVDGDVAVPLPQPPEHRREVVSLSRRRPVRLAVVLPGPLPELSDQDRDGNTSRRPIEGGRAGRYAHAQGPHVRHLPAVGEPGGNEAVVRLSGLGRTILAEPDVTALIRTRVRLEGRWRRACGRR